MNTSWPTGCMIQYGGRFDPANWNLAVCTKGSLCEGAGREADWRRERWSTTSASLVTHQKNRGSLPQSAFGWQLPPRGSLGARCSLLGSMQRTDKLQFLCVITYYNDLPQNLPVGLWSGGQRRGYAYIIMYISLRHGGSPTVGWIADSAGKPILQFKHVPAQRTIGFLDFRISFKKVSFLTKTCGDNCAYQNKCPPCAESIWKRKLWEWIKTE